MMFPLDRLPKDPPPVVQFREFFRQGQRQTLSASSLSAVHLLLLLTRPLVFFSPSSSFFCLVILPPLASSALRGALIAVNACLRELRSLGKLLVRWVQERGDNGVLNRLRIRSMATVDTKKQAAPGNKPAPQKAVVSIPPAPQALSDLDQALVKAIGAR